MEEIGHQTLHKVYFQSVEKDEPERRANRRKKKEERGKRWLVPCGLRSKPFKPKIVHSKKASKTGWKLALWL